MRLRKLPRLRHADLPGPRHLTLGSGPRHYTRLAKNMTTEDEVRAALATVVDPEIGANLIELNMIRRIDISDERVAVDLVLTAPGCPLANWIVEGARQSIAAIPGVKNVEVKVLDEPWTPPDSADGAW